MNELSIKTYSAEESKRELVLSVEFQDLTYVRIEATKTPAAVSRIEILPFRTSGIPHAIVNQRTGGYSIDAEYGFETRGIMGQPEAGRYISAIHKLAEEIYSDPEKMQDRDNYTAWKIGTNLRTVAEKLSRSEYPIIGKK